MNYGPGFGGFGWFGHAIGFIVSGLLFVFLIGVTIFLVFLLIRFLLVATRAAQIYVAKNEQQRPLIPTTPRAAAHPTPPAPAAPAATVVAPPATAPAAKPAAAKPATKPAATPRTRVPKPPTTPPRD